MKNASTATKFKFLISLWGGLFRTREVMALRSQGVKNLIPSDLGEISQFPLCAKIQCKMLIYKI